MPTNWKYIKKLLEKEFLCEKLRGHITYDLTDYRPAPWYQQHFIMKYDDEVLLDVSRTERKWDKRYEYNEREINWVQRNVIAKRLFEKYNLEQYPVSQRMLECIVEDAIDDADKIISHRRGICGVHDIIDEIGTYLHSDIEKCLEYGQDDFIHALGVLDRRCGERRLKKYAARCYTGLPEWLRRIYQIRFEAEGIQYDKHYNVKT